MPSSTPEAHSAAQKATGANSAAPQAGIENARKLKRREGRLGDTWHLDELFVKIQGELQYLWRAVDQDGDVIDILVQPRRNRRVRPSASFASS